MRSLDRPCGEQGKLPTAKAFKLAERDKFMSEQKQTGFFQELDSWIDSMLQELGGIGDEGLYLEEVEKFKKAIRTKVLDSYRNGQKAGPQKFKSVAKGIR